MKFECDTCEDTGERRVISYDPLEGELEFDTIPCRCKIGQRLMIQGYLNEETKREKD